LITKRPPITLDTCLFIDLETISTVDLRRAGVHVYAAHPSTDVLCARFVLGAGEEIEEWLIGDPVPETIIKAAADPNIYFSAHNAGFEYALMHYVLTPKYGWPALPYERFHCTAAECAAMALPRSLEDAAIVLGLPVKKDKEGYNLMMQMCKPRRGAAA